ncbi:hypothetical protein KP806_11815 [Paenibacillus sp. N4]|uniref:hypothetical protein n=1 Tax=Paenibacillus vietnamensis TaxID=2590547 RepID=UPI001CD0D549|nr:hypothetical protein [Paenibacillus vietnamensis]MCA0755735.1 hypothetical protein [Paenibacillus vietnamensis]
MMRFEDSFYCISCGKMVANPDADILFRTGFFQVVHPMGYCLACSMEEDKQESTAESPGKTSNYDLKMFLRADAKAAEHIVHPF